VCVGPPVFSSGPSCTDRASRLTEAVEQWAAVGSLTHLRLLRPRAALTRRVRPGRPAYDRGGLLRGRTHSRASGAIGASRSWGRSARGWKPLAGEGRLQGDCRRARQSRDSRSRIRAYPAVLGGNVSLAGCSRLSRLVDGETAWRTEGEGFEPSIRLTTDNGFRDRRIRPLCHPSAGGPAQARNGEGGIRTLDAGIHPRNALAGRRLQPLGHFSRPWAS
jgi:hypothetical protein